MCVLKNLPQKYLWHFKWVDIDGFPLPQLTVMGISYLEQALPLVAQAVKNLLWTTRIYYVKKHLISEKSMTPKISVCFEVSRVLGPFLKWRDDWKAFIHRRADFDIFRWFHLPHIWFEICSSCLQKCSKSLFDVYQVGSCRGTEFFNHLINLDYFREFRFVSRSSLHFKSIKSAGLWLALKC